MATPRATSGGRGHDVDVWEQAAQEALGFIKDGSIGAVDERLTDAQFQFLSFLYQPGIRTNVYNLSKAFKDDPVAKTRLSLATAYRVADWLEEHGLIEVVDTELSSKNRIPMPIYGITDHGRSVLKAEIVRTMKLSLFGLVPAGAGR